jgi:magnesium-transporting ATPase (P-type)
MEDIRKDFTFHATTVEEATVSLKSDIVQGLTINQVKERIEQFGLNTITEAKTISAFQILVNQFKSPIVFLLLFAASMSFWFKEWLDGSAILFVIFINAAIGFYMEFKAQVSMPLEKKLDVFSKKLIKITVGLVVLIFFAGLLNGQHFMEMLETSIALAVAAIPEGLPIVVTMSLAQGMLKLARYNVIVKKLSAVETLGGTNVICTDKTGTLTQNKICPTTRRRYCCNTHPI